MITMYANTITAFVVQSYQYNTLIVVGTSRDRPKSAPYPRLKNSKKTSKCQVLFYSTRKSNFFEKKIFEKITYSKKWTEWHAGARTSASPWRAKFSQCRKTERGDPLRFFNIDSVAKHEKIEENKNFHFREKISQCRKKTEKGDPLGLFNIHSVAIVLKHQKKCRGDPLGKVFFRKKSLAVPEKMKGGSLWSRPVWYVTRKNRKNLFGSVR